MADYFRVDTLWCVRQAGSRAGGAVDIVVTGEVSPDHGRQTNWQTDRQRGVAVCVSPTQHVHGCIDVLSIYSVCSIVQYSIVEYSMYCVGDASPVGHIPAVLWSPRHALRLIPSRPYAHLSNICPHPPPILCTCTQVVFLYSTWLKGSIESNTYAELDDVFASWRDAAVAACAAASLLSHQQQQQQQQTHSLADDALPTEVRCLLSAACLMCQRRVHERGKCFSPVFVLIVHVYVYVHPCRGALWCTAQLPRLSPCRRSSPPPPPPPPPRASTPLAASRTATLMGFTTARRAGEQGWAAWSRGVQRGCSLAPRQWTQWTAPLSCSSATSSCSADGR